MAAETTNEVNRDTDETLTQNDDNVEDNEGDDGNNNDDNHNSHTKGVALLPKKKNNNNSHHTTNDEPVFLGNGVVEFSVDAIRTHVVCSLCQGFYRDPVTTTKCRHTFCRSCLGTAVDAGCYDCPVCDTYLGQDVTKFALPDHVLQDLIDKVLFPQIAAADAAAECQFYRRLGIPPKLDATGNNNHNTVTATTTAGQGIKMNSSSQVRADFSLRRSSAVPTTTASRKRKQRPVDPTKQVTVEVLPYPDNNNNNATTTSSDGNEKASLPKLDYPLLRTESTLRIGQLKKYLALKLTNDTNQDNKSAENPPPPVHHRPLEILCHGTCLGDELTLAFVERTVWMEADKNLQLIYRYVANPDSNAS